LISEGKIFEISTAELYVWQAALFTEGKGSRLKSFGALLLGGYRGGKLRYFGHSGSGFSEKGLRETIERLRSLFIDTSPVVNPPKIPEKIQWVNPVFVREVAFAEWMVDGVLVNRKAAKVSSG
jgi:bifunctional non-homologous end joining protein LigD